MLTYSDLWNIQEPVLTMAVLIEGYIRSSGRIKKWRKINKNWLIKIQRLNWHDVKMLSNKFYGLFIAIFGSEPISFRRITTASISSLFFVSVFFYFIHSLFFVFTEYSDTIILWTKIDPIKNYLFGSPEVSIYSANNFFRLAYNSIVMNLTPDIISLAETGYILRLSTKENANIPKLFALDLLLTTLIWVCWHLIALFIYSLSINSSFTADFILLHYSTEVPPVWWAFVLSTYSTSIIWWLFIFTAVTNYTFKRISILFSNLLKSNIVTECSIGMFIGAICFLCWPILFLARTIFL